MALNVTPGAPDADSYADLATATTYADARGLTFPGDDNAAAEQALRRATGWIDATYRARFPGIRVNGRNQALEWPRGGVVDISGYSVDYTTIPAEIVKATCEAAVRELAKPGSLSPDIIPGQIKKAVRVEGAVSVEYAVGSADAASQQPVSLRIDGILASLIVSSPMAYTAMAVRG